MRPQGNKLFYALMKDRRLLVDLNLVRDVVMIDRVQSAMASSTDSFITRYN